MSSIGSVPAAAVFDRDGPLSNCITGSGGRIDAPMRQGHEVARPLLGFSAGAVTTDLGAHWCRSL